ncbi:MAG TPA: ASKHA domain-containing protein [Candidatus Latescibacteria bacterium]|jgi:uncharacterized 2Fe-2S/4Fe-4S cluster protein (DUF4445 family)|nr:ferredoxin [Gemmatimonadota bacterium]MDP7362264.1 ASKHA domain-containing protein [Candidatus Latescibacterota bacterium]MDP7635725.1 ASKHA domain-containing protein [Candidatus Latescibacterota bacterium]HJN30879.1 ASKHA domain-containing protein [Candidatus Latescibacterota bacterium]
MADVGCGDQRLPLIKGRTLFDYADDLQAQVPTSCLRNGYCHECVVAVEQGAEQLSPLTEAESFLSPPYRLACQARIEEEGTDVRFTPLRRTPQILSASQSREVDLNPMVTLDGTNVYYDDEWVDTFRGHVLGLAVDLGTTTIVLELIDLLTGDSLSVVAFENPQRFGGSDVMNRISYDGGPHHGELQKAVTTAINRHIANMGEKFGFRRQEIYEITIAGNSTMRDLLFRLDVQPIGTRPYKSTVEEAFRNGERGTTAVVERSRRLGLRANIHTRVYGLPLIASHVGADTAADLVAIDLLEPPDDQIVMLVDVGTNTEVIIAGKGRMLAASSPAGPAFEGGLVQYGMPGYEGAIESVTIDGDGNFGCRVIGDAAPVGICGSGLVDLLAELRRSEMMSERGVIGDGRERNQSVLLDEARGITFSSEDASHLAQAKAANYCGQLLLMRQFGVDASGIDRLYLAGGFANYIDVDNAMAIGFIVPVAADRVEKIGNAALQGAREVLIDRQRRTRLEQIVPQIDHVELETDPTFFDTFVDGCMFQPMLP